MLLGGHPRQVLYMQNYQHVSHSNHILNYCNLDCLRIYIFLLSANFKYFFVYKEAAPISYLFPEATMLLEKEHALSVHLHCSLIGSTGFSFFFFFIKKRTKFPQNWFVKSSYNLLGFKIDQISHA